MRIIITNAPEAYDYRWVIPVLPVGVITWEGRKVRLVRVDDHADAAYQRDRYLSGSYVAVWGNDPQGELATDPDFDESVGVVWPERV